MYDNVEKAISDMQSSRHGHSKKYGKYGKTCKDNSCMMPQISPIEMGNCMSDMPMDMSTPMLMDMNIMKMNLMDMSSPIFDMNSPMEMNMCGCQFPMTEQMLSPQMLTNPVPQCVQELYVAYPYLNPNR